MEMQLDIDKFLMFELSDICSEVEDQELRAYAVVMTIAAAGDEIQESWVKLYISQCPVDKEQMDIHIAAFQGMELLNIKCDCEKFRPECMAQRFKMHNGYRLGKKYLANESIEYVDAKSRVDSLKNDLLF